MRTKLSSANEEFFPNEIHTLTHDSSQNTESLSAYPYSNHLPNRLHLLIMHREKHSLKLLHQSQIIFCFYNLNPALFQQIIFFCSVSFHFLLFANQHFSSQKNLYQICNWHIRINNILFS